MGAAQLFHEEFQTREPLYYGSRYIGVMLPLAILAVFLSSALSLQTPAPPKPKPEPQEELPPEEDVSAKPKEYSFNPLQAENEMKVGNYYMKRNKFRAAAQRFREATLWNNTLAEAFERLGEAEEKAHEKQAAREAYAKFLEIASDSKEAEAVRKRMRKL